MQSPLKAYLVALHARLVGLRQGEVASYIPALANADPNKFGICLVTMDGEAYCVGDCDHPFTLQSISKPFVYATALADQGCEFVTSRVGVEPSGDAFNSISLDPHSGAPLNPMINAGAIATAGLVAGDTPEAQWQRIEASLGAFIGHDIRVDDEVCQSESETGFRNRAIAWMLKNFGVIAGHPMPVLENYFRQCSILVHCRDLAYMAATLANGGTHPLTGAKAIAPEHVERVLSVMTTCGMYDFAGSWLYEVGMPAKSGVGGGIIAVLPGRFGIGVFSPRLDEKGNSVRGIEVCKQLSKDFGLHVFARVGNPGAAVSRVYTAADAPSRRQLTAIERTWLNTQAHKIKYLCLHGLLTVDSMEYVIRQMRLLVPNAHSYILDMHKVSAMTESAANFLNQARLGLLDEGITVVCSRVKGCHAIIEPLSRSTCNDDVGFLIFEDNDLAAEWCENQLLGDIRQVNSTVATLADSRLLSGMPEHLLRQVKEITHVVEFAAGESAVLENLAKDMADNLRRATHWIAALA